VGELGWVRIKSERRKDGERRRGRRGLLATLSVLSSSTVFSVLSTHLNNSTPGILATAAPSAAGSRALQRRSAAMSCIASCRRGRESSSGGARVDSKPPLWRRRSGRPSRALEVELPIRKPSSVTAKAWSRSRLALPPSGCRALLRSPPTAGAGEAGQPEPSGCSISMIEALARRSHSITLVAPARAARRGAAMTSCAPPP